MRHAHMIAVPRPPYARVLLWSVLAATLLFAAARLIEPKPAPEPTVRPSAGAPLSYDAAKAFADRRIAGLSALAEARRSDWVMHERVALAYMSRARLTGSFDDWALAQRALDAAFAHAAPGAGPHLTQASLALSLHRLDSAEQMLAAASRYAVRPSHGERMAAALMTGDIALYHGGYSQALDSYRAVAREGPDADHRLALFWARMGEPDRSLALLDRVAQSGSHSAQDLAAIALQQGVVELQRGRWNDAEAAFTRADRLFPGWWLAQAHMAQMKALRGDTLAARQAFERIAARHDEPLLSDAVASLYRAAGDYEPARRWADQASRHWSKRVRLLPEAALGHAAEHELAFGTSERALTLASRDFALRPHGATAITLAWALIANNRPADALRLIERVNRSSWSSAEQHLVAARAHALLGQGEAAAEAEKRALAINPRALDASAATLWFGH